jgi:hypothetical protein
MVKKPTLILLGLLVLLGVFAWWFQNSPNSAANKSTPTPTTISNPLSEWKFADTRLIKFVDPAKFSLTLRMGKDMTSWSIDENPEVPVDAGKVMQVLSELQSMSPLAKLDAASGEEAMGLGTGSKTITLVDSSGVTKEIMFGKITATASGTYIKTGNNLFIINTPVIDNLTGLLTLEGIVKATALPTPVSSTPQP